MDNLTGKHEGGYRGFYRSDKAYYSRGSQMPEIVIGIYFEEGGTTGEFSVKWEKLSNKLVPKMGVYDDSWEALQLFSDLLSKMAEVDDENISPDDFCKVLISLGISDRTKYKDPDVPMMMGIEQAVNVLTRNPIEKINSDQREALDVLLGEAGKGVPNDS